MSTKGKSNSTVKDEAVVEEKETTEVVVDQKDEMIKQLMESLKSMQAEIASLKEEKKQASSAQQPIYVAAPNTDVKLVYLSDSLGSVSLPGFGVDLTCTKYGDTFSLSRSQFDAVVGKYRRWFEEGILAVSPDDIKVAAEKGIRTSAEYALSYDKLASMGRMSVNELENLWNSVSLPEQKMSIVTFYKRKFIEGDPLFINREKIDLLNRLTDDGFSREADELSGRNYTYKATSFVKGARK
nr:MAG TPA: hypothetical protein [Bacteriophage sp.]